MLISSYKAYTLVEIVVVVAVIAILLSVALPNYLKSGIATAKTVCINNLKKIDAAIEQWAIEHNIPAGTLPSGQQEEEIYGYIDNGKAMCPSRGEYTIYTVGDKPQVRCSREEEGHKLPE